MEEIVGEPSHGEKLCDSIFQFHRPKVPVQLEVVLIHGLEDNNSGDAYWKTWLAQDGTKDNIWPMTWLPEELSYAQVFALKYDASKVRTDTEGRMDLYVVGESLLQEMVDFAGIGQNGVPVVLVCHGFGGLVAKQIVVNARDRFSHNFRAKKLLQNIGGLLFYATPHHGSHLAKSSAYLGNDRNGVRSPLLDNFEVLNAGISRLNQEFERAKDKAWYFKSGAETHEIPLYGQMVVEEGSSRYADANFLSLCGDHFDIVRPKTRKDSSYLLLITCLKEVLARVVDPLPSLIESLELKSLVRLKGQEEEMKRMLGRVDIVGLVGMGGIGKTTLAKAVFQSMCKDFERGSYLDDVNSKTSLDEVLILLLQHFGIKDRKTSCIAQQSDLKDSRKALVEDLKLFVKQHKVLVVVDDVGTRENLKRLLMDMGFLDGHKDSKLIVTCRNWQELEEYVPVNGMYEVELMKASEDIELFSYHAFRGARTQEQRVRVLREFLLKDSSEQLLDDFGSLCDSIVAACAGLPLSLEVVGACLGGYLRRIGNISGRQCLEYWQGALGKLKNAESMQGGSDNDRLWKVLRISFNALNEKEKSMFLDIACFFCGFSRYGEEALVRIWGGDPSKKIELQNLKDRCLVKVNKEDGTIIVHDQLRDMGRSIVSSQGERDVKDMTRLWECKDVRKLLQNNKITSTHVQGLSLGDLSISWKIPIWRRLTINCPSMRLLNLQGVKTSVIESINMKYSSSIYWLCLKGNMTRVPLWVWDCESLFVLDMQKCTSLKRLHKSIAKLVNLLELNLDGCRGLTSLPDSIGKLGNLSKLNLSRCEGLTSLLDSIGNLAKLLELHLYGCGGLISLPDSIGKLGNLLKLNLSRCKGLISLPDSIGKLGNLSKLDLSRCEGLISLPDSIGKLGNLSKLDLSRCKGLISLPDSISKLVNLSKLDLYGCWRLTSLPDSIGKLGNLSKLYLYECGGLTSLPDSIGKLGNLSKLNLSRCEGLISLPDSIGKLGNLSELDLYECGGLTSLPDSIGKLSNLSKLNLSRCEGLISLPDSIGKLGNLSKLDLYGCGGLISLVDSIGKLGNLLELDLSGCWGLTSLPDSLGKLGTLSKLDLYECWGLTSLPDSIGKLGNLLKLNLYKCKGLTSLPDSIGNLAKLLELDLHRCGGLTGLPDSIGKLGNLSKLDLSWCKGLSSLPDSIGKLGNLSELYLYECGGLVSLPDSIGKLGNLSKLNLLRCEGLTSLPDSIGKLGDLLELHLYGCWGLTSLPDSIGKLGNLLDLDLYGCWGLTSLPDSIGKLGNLSKLNLSRCEGLISLPDSISKLGNLSKLNLSWCKGLTSLPDSIGNLPKLLELDLYRCRGLTSLPDSIGKLGNLSKLHLYGCGGLTSLPDSISKLGNLLELYLYECGGLTSLPDSIGKLGNLSELDLSECKGLTSLPDSIGKLGNLSKLNLSWCKGLTSLPDSIGKLGNLSELDLYGCWGLTSLPDSIANLAKLSKLDLSECKGLTSLSDSIANLAKL